MHVIARLLLDEIYPLLGIRIRFICLIAFISTYSFIIDKPWAWKLAQVLQTKPNTLDAHPLLERNYEVILKSGPIY